ncbi:MAG: DUF6873 family GME fold protein [Clostridium sp.]
MICFVDYRITEEEEKKLSLLGFNPIKTPKCPTLYPAIDGHVDIQMNILDKNSRSIIVHKDMPSSFLKALEKNNVNYIFSEGSLGSKYPECIKLNAFVCENYFFHNLKFTDNALIRNVSQKIKVNVTQGYTKCSILPIKENVIVTSDKVIYKSAILNGFDCLLLPPGDILLPGLDYGFIGGVGGMIDSSTLALFGELSFYAYGNELLDFLTKHDISVISLKKGKLFDRGSLFVI